jgi:hypothetical protein|tara:strand:+ start:6328 stop:7038 length:711 start_codon:yes stop_codon:yes gene_type:complete
MYFKNIKNTVIDIDGSGNFDKLKNLTAKAKVSNDLINNAGFYQTVEVIDGERPDHLSKRLYNTDDYHWTFLLLNPHLKNIWDDWPMKWSQLIEYCTEKYQYLAGDTDDDLNDKFTLGETVTGGVSGAKGILKEIHVNMGYIVIEKTSGTFVLTGETIQGASSSDSVTCGFIKSQAYAPHHHVDDSTGEWVKRRLAGTTPYTYIDYESAVTEQNRNLKVIKPEHISSVAREFINVMR